jgi:3-isopropylmalate/(R)-2-methylmalate dehydratase small subunit
VVAESYARIFFRNSVATGELYPIESEGTNLTSECKTGDIVTLDIEQCVLINHTQNKTFPLKSLGDAEPVIDAGGIFEFARKTGMIGGKKEVILQQA